MALDTFTDVSNEVADWLFGRSDLIAKVPTFIRLCEAKGNRELRCRQMEKRAKATVRLDTLEPDFISLPADFHSMRRIRLLDAVNGPKALRFKTGAQIDDLRERDAATPGEPIWFTILGTEIEVCPTPVTANVVEMVYRTKIPPLTADNPSNWLLQDAPDFYLFGTLMEAAPYLREDGRIATWDTGLQGAIDGLNKWSDEAIYNAGPLTASRKGRAY